MRLRKVKNAKEKLCENNNYFVLDGREYKGKWNELFPNKNPLNIEIGCGKGQFMITLAKRNPDINYVAIEKYDSVLLRTLEKANEVELSNLKLTIMDAEHISEYFDKGEVSRIYLNFSDPWPKERHAKRRLTSPDFLSVYRQLLKKDGLIEFKTDNRGLFEYSLQSVTENHYHLDYVSLDLHNSPEAEDNIMTEYERKFSVNGPIYKMILSDTMEKNNG